VTRSSSRLSISNLEEAGYKGNSVKVIEVIIVLIGNSLSRTIVWDDSRTREIVAHYEHLLRTKGIKCVRP
jgi:glycerol kinase